MLACAAVALAACGDPTAATVTTWAVGSSTVSGTVHNGEGRNCSDMRVTLHERDVNGAIVRDFEFGAGGVDQDKTKPFTTQIVGMFYVEGPVPAKVTAISAEARCADRT